MIAYFDCFSGISGDMTLGAFINLGVPVEWLKDALSTIPLTGFDISTTSIRRMGIHADQVTVIDQENTASRNYGQIKDLIENSPLVEPVKTRSLRIFEKIAAAEARIHDKKVEETHFHEVGGIDAIVDIVGAALCVAYLGSDRIVSSKIPLGKGFVSCRHGILPIPAPATLAILKGVPTYGTDISKELVTPTGAAIISSFADSFQDIPEMTVGKIGYGAGQRDLETIPNLLRIITGTEPDLNRGYQQDDIVLVETSIDDMNPEVFGFVMDRLFEDGALDVCWIPIHMKKNRPGTMVQILCRKEHREAIIDRLLTETTSIGVRYYEARRRILSRESQEVQTSYGTVRVKCIRYPNGATRMVPEYEVCKDIALKENVPIRIVYDTISKEAAK